MHFGTNIDIFQTLPKSVDERYFAYQVYGSQVSLIPGNNCLP